MRVRGALDSKWGGVGEEGQARLKAAAGGPLGSGSTEINEKALSRNPQTPIRWTEDSRSRGRGGWGGHRIHLTKHETSWRTKNPTQGVRNSRNMTKTMMSTWTWESYIRCICCICLISLPYSSAVKNLESKFNPSWYFTSVGTFYTLKFLLQLELFKLWSLYFIWHFLDFEVFLQLALFRLWSFTTVGTF